MAAKETRRVSDAIYKTAASAAKKPQDTSIYVRLSVEEKTALLAAIRKVPGLNLNRAMLALIRAFLESEAAKQQ
jgi:hypothetical protein